MFSSGNTTAFGSAAPKPTGFGSPFGGTATTSTTGFGGFGSSGFGSSGSTFGTPAPAFGSTPAPAFGSTFGSVPATSAAPAFGSFGATATSAAPAFGTGAFGSTTTGIGTTPSLFGSIAATKPSLFSTPSSVPPIFSTPAASSAPSFFGQTTPSLFGSAPTSTTLPSLFGTATSTAPSLFGSSTFGSGTTGAGGGGLFGSGTTGTSTTPGFGLFGSTATTSAPTLFGSSFGAPATTNTTFSGFGAGMTGFGGFGGTSTSGTGQGTGLFGASFGAKPAITAPQQTAAPSTESANLLASFYAVSLFGDERDEVLKKWNMLQACWGTGRGYYNPGQAPVEYTTSNPYFRFKACAYNIIPDLDNSEGMVSFIFNRKEAEINSQRQALIALLNSILGNRPTLTVTIEMVRSIAEDQVEVRVTVRERSTVTGSQRRIPASELCQFLRQPAPRQQLVQAGCNSCKPYVTPSKQALEEHRRKPPAGIDAQMWEAANQDNPNPGKYIPCAVRGFAELKGRMLAQQHESALHVAFARKVDVELAELRKRHLASVARIQELKQRFLIMQHRILRVLVKQESTRKAGMAISPEEELLRGRLEMLHSQLKVPTQFRGQIVELMSRVRMMSSGERTCRERYIMDADAQEDIGHFLKLEQRGISQLVAVIGEDLRALQIMQEGMGQLQQAATNRAGI